jgi:hypothetical protein
MTSVPSFLLMGALTDQNDLTLISNMYVPTPARITHTRELERGSHQS